MTVKTILILTVPIKSAIILISYNITKEKIKQSLRLLCTVQHQGARSQGLLLNATCSAARSLLARPAPAPRGRRVIVIVTMVYRHYNAKARALELSNVVMMIEHERKQIVNYGWLSDR